MTTYNVRFVLYSSPRMTTDGSCCVMHDVGAEYSSMEMNWQVVPERHKTIAVPAEDIIEALSASSTSARIEAYKQALVSNVDNLPKAVLGWSPTQIQSLLTYNAVAGHAASEADSFITTELGQSYPVRFTL